jgi:hypothetical protein
MTPLTLMSLTPLAWIKATRPLHRPRQVTSVEELASLKPGTVLAVRCSADLSRDRWVVYRGISDDRAHIQYDPVPSPDGKPAGGAWPPSDVPAPTVCQMAIYQMALADVGVTPYSGGLFGNGLWNQLYWIEWPAKPVELVEEEADVCLVVTGGGR